MNYKEFIQSIIDTRGQWSIPECGIWENHHIVPLCMGGQPEVYYHDTIHENMIWLAPREHFIAHELLAEENSDNGSIVSAYWQMATKNTANGKIIITPEEYEAAKILFSNYLHNKEITELTRENMSKAAIERNKKYGNPMLGRKHSECSKQKMSNNRRGKGTGKRPKETRIKISKALKGKPKSEAAKLHNLMSQKKYWSDMPEDKYKEECLKRSERSKKFNLFKNFGDQTGGNNPRAVKVECIETGEIFCCIKYAREKYSIKYNDMKLCLEGKIETAGGFHWKKV